MTKLAFVMTPPTAFETFLTSLEAEHPDVYAFLLEMHPHPETLPSRLQDTLMESIFALYTFRRDFPLHYDLVNELLDGVLYVVPVERLKAIIAATRD
jgi:hypothetical protein